MRFILVDEHRAFCESLRIALQQEASITVLAEVDSARQLYALAEADPPDLVVSELMLRDTDGISVARELRRRRIPSRMMLLTMYSNPLFVSEAREAGILGYALKEQPLGEIVQAMRTVSGGEQYLAPAVASVPPSLGRKHAVAAAGMDGWQHLSHREREVFWRIIRGDSSQAIADSLCISIKTVETHRTHINRKLGVRSPVELIRLAALQGLLTAEPRLAPTEPPRAVAAP
jgi:DNA-binding NarL/FixJ family response regulator